MRITPFRGALYMFVIVFTFFTIAINSQAHGWLAWYRIYRFGQETQATITQQQPENHQRCFFKYKINSRQYEASDSGCASLPIGSVVSATYLPTDPTFATLSSPREEFAFILFTPLFFSVIAGFVGAWQAKIRLRSTSK